MRPAVAAVLTILLPGLAGAQTTLTPLPGEFAGKQRAVMQAVFPGWDETTGATGGAGQHARLVDSRLIDLPGRHLIVVLAETSQGEPCHAATCPPAPLDIGIIEQLGPKIQLIAAGRSVAKSGGGFRAWLDTTARKFDAKTPLVSVNEEQTVSGATQAVLRLLRMDGGVLRLAFERHVRWQHADAKCEATVHSDDVDVAPYPLKVTDTCKPSGRTAIEVWRWPAKTEVESTYQLHGPASDADEPDATTEE